MYFSWTFENVIEQIIFRIYFHLEVRIVQNKEHTTIKKGLVTISQLSHSGGNQLQACNAEEAQSGFVPLSQANLFSPSPFSVLLMKLFLLAIARGEKKISSSRSDSTGWSAENEEQVHLMITAASCSFKKRSQFDVHNIIHSSAPRPFEAEKW